MKQAEFATLKIDDKEIELPIVTGTEGEKGLDIGMLRKQTGYVTIDPGFMNTAACYSKITFIDGERGILRYRGIPVEELVDKHLFIEVAYLLVHGSLPNEEEKVELTSSVNISTSPIKMSLQRATMNAMTKKATQM